LELVIISQKMKRTILYFLLLLILGFSGCKAGSDTSKEVEKEAKTPVQVTHISKGTVKDELTLFGTTMYMKRNAVTAPIPAYITEVTIKLGDRVEEGQILYVLQSKESRALGNDISTLDSSLNNFGIIRVKASASGIISTLDKQQSGEYVLEGAQLCTIAESSDLIFQVNVPYEYTSLAIPEHTCIIVLPDTSSHQAIFTRALTTMNVQAQTQTILAKTTQNLFLPENMIVKVKVQKGDSEEKQLLPRKAIASDEMLQEFWIMKLINDSTAIKQTVVLGNKDSDWVEILSPEFDENDRIISEGSFGLPDTARVSINHYL